MSEVKVTVLMPAFNAEKYIGEAIHSILKQTFTDFELLIVNDGSSDNTATIVQNFEDQRIRLLERPHRGISLTLNEGLKEANGEYIARFDADDIALPERLEKQISFLDHRSDHVLVGCDAEYITENGEHLFNFRSEAHSHEEVVRQLHVNCPFIHSGVMYRKQIVLEAGGYSPEAHNFEDHLLWIKLAAHGKYSNLPERLIKVRFNPSSVTMDERWLGQRFRQIKKNSIARGYVTKNESDELITILDKQNKPDILKASYFALCGKKFLLNNFQPALARNHFAKAISTLPSRLDNYALYMVTFFPKPIITWLHKKVSDQI